ncbi:MAG: cytochrome P450 [Actinomycetota bacterium]
MSVIDYDPYSRAAFEDPFPFYARLRDEAPCYFIEARNSWALSRFEDVWTAHFDTDHYTATTGTLPWEVMSDNRETGVMLHHMDPPDHTELLRAVWPWFSAKAMDDLDPQIEQIARSLVAAALEKESFDLVHDLAWPMAAQVTALVCGLPPEAADDLARNTERSQDREPGVTGMTPVGDQAIADTFSYLMAVAEERRAAGFDGDTLIDRLGTLTIGGEPIGDDLALAIHISMFYLGGASQFPKGFSALAYRLFQHPDQRAAIVDDPSLAEPAFLEALRIDNPTQMLGRRVVERHEIHGNTLEPDQGVLFLYASAGRDEREFPDPDRFDIRRDPKRTISFGAGPHRCTGANLGTREGVKLLQALLDAMPDYVIDDSDLQVIETEYMRGWEELPTRPA